MWHSWTCSSHRELQDCSLDHPLHHILGGDPNSDANFRSLDRVNWRHIDSLTKEKRRRSQVDRYFKKVTQEYYKEFNTILTYDRPKIKE